MGEARWPSAIATDDGEIAVQVDGRTVGRVPADRVDTVTDDPRVARRLAGRTVVRTVHIEGRLVNLVTRGGHSAAPSTVNSAEDA